MSQPRKKVVATKRTATTIAARARHKPKVKEELLFTKKNYILMAAGAGLVLLGLILMSGGAMPSPDVWDDSLIYSFRRITLAPVVILAGLALEIYAIFAREKVVEVSPEPTA